MAQHVIFNFFYRMKLHS